MHALLPCEGPVESIISFIQNPLNVLCVADSHKSVWRKRRKQKIYDAGRKRFFASINNKSCLQFEVALQEQDKKHGFFTIDLFSVFRTKTFIISKAQNFLLSFYF